MNTIINKRMNKKGFTLAELMLTVAIIIILGALAMVGVTRYLRGLRLLEMDNAAREIFYAAQNRITAELNSGTLGRLDPSSQMKTDKSAAGTKQMKDSVGNDVGYVVVFPDATDKTKVLNVDDPLDATLWDELLPFGSIDDTLRLGGSYIINYSYDPDANMATVLDVWFASDEGSGFFRNWNGSEAALLEADYGDLDAARKDKSNRRNFKGNAVIGYYGSDTVTALNELYNFHNLSFELINDEVLYGEFSFQAKRLRSSELELQQGNLDGLNPQLKITITGEKSRAQKTLRYDTTTKNLYPYNSEAPLSISVVKDVTETNSSKFEFQIVLDDITETVGERFRDLVATVDDGSPEFKLGEDIRVNVEVYTNGKLANIESVTAMDNSLFQYVKSTTDAGTTTTEAGIGKIRHLQNLSNAVSSVVLGDAGLNIDQALQTAKLDWNKFTSYEKVDSTKIGGKIVYNSNSKTEDAFLPIDFLTSGTGENFGESYFTYDAQYIVEKAEDTKNNKTGNYSISNLVVKGENAGLFGTIGKSGETVPGLNNKERYLLTVKNLEIDNATVKGNSTAGAVVANEVNAAYLSDITINSSIVEATGGAAGGAVGKAANGLDLLGVHVSGTSSVKASGYSGGLLGEFNGASASHFKINVSNETGSCSSVGDKDSGNITVESTGSAAGGLVGAITKGYPQIANSYSTALVSGTTAGGLIGKIEESDSQSYIKSCYVGGHTENGTAKYNTAPNNCNVKGTTVAGGFIGSVGANAANISIQASYSTASASGQGAGGFIGEVLADIRIDNCYAVGLVKDTEPASTDGTDLSPSGAFVGNCTAALSGSGNIYFELINEGMSSVAGTAGTDFITSAEDKLETYNKFVQFYNHINKYDETVNPQVLMPYENEFFPYDTGMLGLMFGTKYFLPTASELPGADANAPTTHVGDWQPVDTLVFNTKSTTPTEP